MTVKVAVIAHSDKSFGGGLSELRSILERRGIDRLRWREVPKAARRRSRCEGDRLGRQLIFV